MVYGMCVCVLCCYEFFFSLHTQIIMRFAVCVCVCVLCGFREKLRIERDIDKETNLRKFQPKNAYG